MKSAIKLICVAAAAFCVSTTTIAAPILNDWVFNPVGGGLAGGQVINKYLNVSGNAFIQLQSTGETAFSFRETAVFNIPQADSNGQLFGLNYIGGNITATLEAVGNGTFGGAFNFTSGTIRLYQNPVGNQYGTTLGFYGANLGNVIAELDITGGGGEVDVAGSPINNGQVSVFANAGVGKLDARYFLNSNGTDLSTESILAFAFTDTNTVGLPSRRLINEVACQFAGFNGPGCGGGNYQNVPRQHFFLSANGELNLGMPAEVPEPGSMALFGLAMLGMVVVSRKRQ